MMVFSRTGDNNEDDRRQEEGPLSLLNVGMKERVVSQRNSLFWKKMQFF